MRRSPGSMRLARWLLALLFVAAANARAQTVVIMVRHAEKAAAPADDPPLTSAGEARARDLLQAVRNAGISAIITTQYARTRGTAQPAAAALGLTPEIVPATSPTHVQDVVAAIRRHAGQTVLVVGHSNTVPAIIEALGAKRPAAICDPVYDNLFVVTIDKSGKAGVIQSKFGAATPPDSACAAMMK